MEYIKNTIKYPLYTSRAFQLYFEDMDIGVLDIETTGLSPKNSAFVLGGLLTPENEGLLAEQYFVENLSEEQTVLHDFWLAACEKDVLITFNGQHFDLPFMKERFKMATDAAGKQSSDTIDYPAPYHLDLFLLVKNYSPVRKFLPNLKQKTIENYMGLWQYRKDEISGKESVDLYYQFLTERNSERETTKAKILLHNHDDIVQLYRLLKVIEKCDLHRAMFNMGFPIKSIGVDTPSVVIENIIIKNGQLKIIGRQYRNPADYQCFDFNGNTCYVHFHKAQQAFSIELPLIEQSGLTLLDLEALEMNPSPLSKYPTCQEGFLILQNAGETNYLEINHFTKLFIKKIISQL